MFFFQNTIGLVFWEVVWVVPNFNKTRWKWSCLWILGHWKGLAFKMGEASRMVMVLLMVAGSYSAEEQCEGGSCLGGMRVNWLVANPPMHHDSLFKIRRSEYHITLACRKLRCLDFMSIWNCCCCWEEEIFSKCREGVQRGKELSGSRERIRQRAQQRRSNPQQRSGIVIFSRAARATSPKYLPLFQ